MAANPFQFITGDTIESLEENVNDFIETNMGADPAVQWYPASIQVEYHGGNPVYVATLLLAGYSYSPYYDVPPLFMFEAATPEDLSAAVSALTANGGDYFNYPPFVVNKHGATYYTTGLQRWLGINNGQGFTTLIDADRSLDALQSRAGEIANSAGFVLINSQLGQPFNAAGVGVGYNLTSLAYYNTTPPVVQTLAWLPTDPLNTSGSIAVTCLVTFDKAVFIDDANHPSILAQSSNTSNTPDLLLTYDVNLASSDLSSGVVAFHATANTLNANNETFTLSSDSPVTGFDLISDAVGFYPAANTLPIGLTPAVRLIQTSD